MTNLDLDLDLPAQHHLDRAVDDLKQEFGGIFSPETVDRYVEESLQRLGRATVQDYIQIFVSRFTRERLRALGQVEGTIAKDIPEVLFVCVQNAGRSQMAAGLLAKHAEGRVHIRSAGSAPGERINPAVVEAMDEVGVDLGRAYPKPLTDEVVEAADVVITMGCGDACPTYPGKRYEDWELDDPAGRELAEVRRIRDEIDSRVSALLGELIED